MAKTVKQILSGAVCLTLLFTMLCLSGCDKSYIGSSKQTLDKLNIQAQIMNNGDMNVVETWTVNLKNRNKAYHKIYKTFGLLGDGKTAVTNYSVYDEDNHIKYKNKEGYFDPTYSDDENICYLTTNSNEQELGLLMPKTMEGVRNFTFRYTVKNQVKSYKDTSVFYYKFISKSFTVPITNMTCTIKLPDGAKKEDLYSWLHCTSKSNLVINSNNQITFTASEVPVGTMVETRICMPPKLFAPSTAISTEKQLENIKSEELKWASDWQSKQQKEYILILIGIVVGTGLVLLGILRIIHRARKYKRRKVDVPVYTHDIPDGNSPEGVANLFYYYDGGADGKKGKSNTISAAFLELDRKGYLTFSQNNKVLTVFLTEKCKNGNWADLSSCEHRFLGLLCSAKEAIGNEGNNSFTMEQFKIYATTNYLSVDSTLNDFFEKSNEDILQKGYFENNFTDTGWNGAILSKLMLWITPLMMIAGLASSSPNITPIYYFISIGVIICGVLIKIGSKFGKIKPLTEVGEHDLYVWLGLKKYMLEFSRMKEYGVPQLELWEEYLVYATMMGISKQVCNQLKLVYPEIKDQSYRDEHWSNSSYLHHMFDENISRSYGNSLDTNFDLGSVLSNSISDISHEVDILVHPPTYSGGGSSGGGGCGSGGGGGGFDGGGGGID